MSRFLVCYCRAKLLRSRRIQLEHPVLMVALCFDLVLTIPLGGACEAQDMCRDQHTTCATGQCVCLSGYEERAGLCCQFTSNTHISLTIQ